MIGKSAFLSLAVLCFSVNATESEEQQSKALREAIKSFIADNKKNESKIEKIGTVMFADMETDFLTDDMWVSPGDFKAYDALWLGSVRLDFSYPSSWKLASGIQTVNLSSDEGLIYLEYKRGRKDTVQLVDQDSGYLLIEDRRGQETTPIFRSTRLSDNEFWKLVGKDKWTYGPKENCQTEFSTFDLATGIRKYEEGKESYQGQISFDDEIFNESVIIDNSEIMVRGSYFYVHRADVLIEFTHTYAENGSEGLPTHYWLSRCGS
ncbi:hypothetical protein RN22_09020 [Grimontia sp. AD028]|uniref:hypothetical protein n=1 Tax=Grimontia sp. AD028 TaxID=1581149 RepID=UPI00061B12A7|nr:hypothetical protein [Grimontia sp. AD028]KKD60872.1 hypothetical protein RN22_09020 [Grimontia sp. AD028]